MSLMDRVLNDMAWVGSVRGRSVWRNCTKMHRIYLSGEVSSHRNCLELIGKSVMQTRCSSTCMELRFILGTFYDTKPHRRRCFEMPTRWYRRSSQHSNLRRIGRREDLIASGAKEQTVLKLPCQRSGTSLPTSLSGHLRPYTNDLRQIPYSPGVLQGRR